MAAANAIREIVFWILLVIITLSDCRSNRIPNGLILSGVLFGIASAAFNGLGAVGSAALSGAISLLIGFCLWALHVFKAGDAKLLWMAGCFCLPRELPWLYAFVFVAGGVCALALLLCSGQLAARLKRLGRYFRLLFLQASFTPYQPQENDPLRFPFAAAIFGGEVLLRIFIK